MDPIEVIRTRRSTRKFLDKEIPWEALTTIVDSGRYAPSSGNLQSWKFVLVRDKIKKQNIANACFEQYWISDAYALVVICAMNDKQKEFYEERGKELYAIQNCAAAAENIIIAAGSLGIGSCWIGAFDEQKIKQILEINEPDVQPQIILALGYEKEPEKSQTKFTPDQSIYLEKWRGKIEAPEWFMGWYSMKFKKTEMGVPETKSKIKSLFEKMFSKKQE